MKKEGRWLSRHGEMQEGKESSKDTVRVSLRKSRAEGHPQGKTEATDEIPQPSAG